MKVNFKVKITEKEMYSFLLNNYYRKPMSIIMFIFGLVCYGIAVYSYGSVELMSTCLLIILGALYTVIQPILLWKNAKKQIKKNPVYQNELEYTFDETGITSSQGELTTTMKWEELWKARDYGKLAVIYIYVNNGIILPKAAMGEQYNQFVELVAAHIPSNLKKK